MIIIIIYNDDDDTMIKPDWYPRYVSIGISDMQQF